ncbi:hypothetical protein CUMW_002890 [Citrus unshiu]|nr:hypothetical protein CUMW_002890 [Citrus unshiu]
MSKHQLTSFLIVLLNLGTLVSSLAYDYSYNPPPPLPSPSCPPPPQSPSPKPPPPPPIVYPNPCPPVTKPPPTPEVKPTPPPPVVKPPPPPKVNPTPHPPVVKPPPPPPPIAGYPPPPKQQTCPIDALKLGACVDVLEGLIHTGLARNVKKKCCPLLYGLADLDAAICLCTAIRIKALNLIDIFAPFSLHVLVTDCDKHPPVGFQCPTN